MIDAAHAGGVVYRYRVFQSTGAWKVKDLCLFETKKPLKRTVRRSYLITTSNCLTPYAENMAIVLCLNWFDFNSKRKNPGLTHARWAQRPLTCVKYMYSLKSLKMSPLSGHLKWRLTTFSVPFPAVNQTYCKQNLKFHSKYPIYFSWCNDECYTKNVGMQVCFIHRHHIGAYAYCPTTQ